MTTSLRSLVTLAATTSLALANGGEEPKNAFQSKSNWKPGNGIDLANSEDFKLNLSNQLQVGWSYTDNNKTPDVSTFDVTRARVAFSGHAFSKDVTYLLRLDAVDTEGTILKDGWAQWNFIHDSSSVGLRMGQGKSGFGLESTGAEDGLYFADRSLASQTLSDLRSRGAWLYGSHHENSFRWNLGAQNGDVAQSSTGLILESGEETNNVDNELNFVLNASVDPMGDTTGGKTNEAIRQGNFGESKGVHSTFGIGAMAGNGRNQALLPIPGVLPAGLAANTSDIETATINLNTAWTFGEGLSAQGEVFSRTDTLKVGNGIDQDSVGWYAMATYTAAKSGDSKIQWGFGLRVSNIDVESPDATLSRNATEISGVVDAFYHGHACKTQLEYTYQETDFDVGTALDTTNHILRVQFQLLF